jgi:tape measure domain-containing protein
MGTYARILSRVTLDTRQFQQGLTQVQRQARTAVSRMQDIGSRLSNSITLPSVIGGGLALNAYKEYDSLTRALSTQETTAAGLAKRLEELRQIAKQPGIGFQEAIQGDVRLRAVGISAGQSAKILKEFANAIAQTGGGAQELNSVTVQLGQMAAKGKVFAQDLKPIIEAAPIVGKALSEMFGTVDSESIQKSLNAAGKGSREFIDDLLAKLQQMPRVSGGFKNATENMKDALFQFGASIGASIDKSFNLTDRLGVLSEKIITLGKDFQSLPAALQKFIIGTGAATAAAGPLLSVVGAISNIFIGNGNLASGARIFKSLGSEIIKNRGAIAGWAAALLIGVNVIRDIVKESGAWLAEFKELYNSSRTFRALIDATGKTISQLGNAFKLFGNLAGVAAGGVVQLFRDLKNLVIEVFGGNADWGRKRFVELESSLKDLTLTIYQATGAYISFVNAGKAVTTDDINKGMFKLGQSVYGGSIALRDLQGVTSKIAPEIQNLGKKTGETGNALSKYEEILLKLKTAQAGIDTKASLFGDDAFVLKQSALKSALEDILSLEGGVTKYKAKIAELGAELRVVEGIIANNEATKKRTEYMQEIKDVVDGMSYTQENLNKKTSLYNDILNSAIKTLGPANSAILRLRDIINQNSQALVVNVAGWKGLISDNGQVTEWVNNVGDSFKSLNERLKDKALEGMTKQFENLKSSAQSFGDESRDIFDVIGKSIGIGNNRLQEFASTMSYAIGSIGAISSQLFENRRAQLDNYYERERAYIESSKLTEEAKASALLRLEEQVSKKKRRIAHDEAKAQKRRAIFEATLGAANAIINALKLGPIAGPIAAAFIGGLALAQIGSIASAPLPALAGGGLAYGPTTAIVGDNRNAASDPEVIAPLSKLQNMLNGGEKHIVVTGAIKGQDILLSNRYGADTASRYRA